MQLKIRYTFLVSKYYYVLKMVVYKNTGRTSKEILRSDQDRIDVKSDVNGREIVSIRCSGKAIYGRFRRQGEIR